MMMSYAPGMTIPVASWRRAVSYGELPMSQARSSVARLLMIAWWVAAALAPALAGVGSARKRATADRSEEHTSELQSQSNLVCRLLLEKKQDHTSTII